MASPDELAALFASAWTAGAGARPSSEHAAKLVELFEEARRTQPTLDPREFAAVLASLAPGPEGLASFLGRAASSDALAATLARGSVIATADTAAPSPGIAAGSLGATADTLAPPRARQAPERYRLIRQLGAGAMGVVWEAEDKQLHRRIALKWVTPGAATDKGYRTRLFREARALAQLHHPNVLAVYDVGESGDEVYLALELIDGATARDWMDIATRTPAELVAAWRQVGAGLAAVHAAGLVHRDIKPENVFVAKDGRVVVGDFGLATGALGETVATNLTATGAVVGTPLYMPPEQLMGEPATAQGDQFSLCVCLWEALAGKRPFESTSIAGLAVQMLKPPAIPPGVDRRMFGVLARGLATEAKDRWPDVPALLAALEPAGATTRRRTGLIAIAGALAVGAVGAVTLQRLMRDTPSPPPPAASGSAPVVAIAPQPDAPVAAAPPADAALPPGPKHLATAGSAPPPVAAPSPTKSTWRQHYDDSITAMQTGDGKRCVALLADMASWPADAYREKTSSEAMLGSCIMAAGDCAGGRAQYEKFGASVHLTPDDIAKRIAEADAKWCPLDAPPESAWPARIAKRLETLAYARRSCKVLLDFAAGHNISLAAIPGNQMMFCLVADGKCDEARAVYHRYVFANVPNPPAELVATTEKSFDQINPTCVLP